MDERADGGVAAFARGFVGVYHADGGVIGETRYIVGHLLGTAHCSLCDITHSWRRRPEWDAMVERLGARFDLRHLNELDAELTEAVARSGSPVVFGRTETGLRPVLTPEELNTLGGSVEAFETALRAKVRSISNS